MDVVRVLALLNSKESFKKIVDQIPLHVILTDENGVIVYANNAASMMTGYSNEEIIGNTPALWGKQMDEEFYKDMWDTIKNRLRTFTGIITNRRKNGENYHAAVKISPIMAEEGLEKKKVLVGFVGIEKDLSLVENLKQKYTMSEEDLKRLYDTLFI